jgi:hypothetical protein
MPKTPRNCISSCSLSMIIVLIEFLAQGEEIEGGNDEGEV